MSVKNEADRELIISGYTRENAQRLLSAYHYPIDINHIIIMYARPEMLEFDINHFVAHKYQFVDGPKSNLSMIQTVSGEQHVVLSAKERFVISSSLYKMFYFEIQLIDFLSHGLDFVIGFTRYPAEKKPAIQPRRFLGTRRGECSLYVSTFNNFFDVYCNGSRTKSLRFKSNLQIGSRLGIQFNFNIKKAFVHFNGKVIGMMADRIPNQVVPAISLFNKDITVVCSQWKPIQYTTTIGNAT